MNTTKPLWKGVTLMIAAWTSFAFMSACAKHSYSYTTPIVAFFFQNFIGLLFLSPFFFKDGFQWLKSDKWTLIGFRGALGALSFFCLFYSLSKIPLTDGSLLNNTAPLFVPFLAALFLKTPLKLSIGLSALLGFFGVILILKPTGGIFQIYALPAFASGFMSAVIMILMRLLAKESPKRIIFAYLLLASLCAAPFAVPHLAEIPTAALPALLFIGVFFGFGQYVLTRSFHYAEPTVLAPFTYTFVAVSSLLDWLLWDHAPSIVSALGILLIFMGGVLTIRYSRATAQQPSKPVKVMIE